MAEKTTNYQCPACTGPLHYDGASGKLVCDYCGSAYDVKDIEARYAKKQAAADTAAEGDAKKAARLPKQEGPVWSEAEVEGLNSYSCPTCGAELVCDETTAATLNNGGALAVNHLYMMTIEGRGVKAGAATTKLLVRGSYTIA